MKSHKTCKNSLYGLDLGGDLERFKTGVGPLGDELHYANQGIFNENHHMSDMQVALVNPLRQQSIIFPFIL